MRKTFTTLSLLLILSAFTQVQALANLSVLTQTQEQEPASTTATYGTWTVRCNAVANKENTTATPLKLCKIVQSLRIRKTGHFLMGVALGRLNKTDPISIWLKVPANVWLRSAISITIGNKVIPEFEASYYRCHPQYCLAETQLTSEQQDSLLQAKSIKVGLIDANQRIINVPVSLDGFSQAFNSVFMTP